MSTRDVDRRGFLARLAAIATAPVLTAYAADEQTGLAVPSRQIEVSHEPPPPLLISSSTGVLPITAGTGMNDPNWAHSRMHRGDGTLTFIVGGEAWIVPAFRADHERMGHQPRKLAVPR